jgi:hypothetical protein
MKRLAGLERLVAVTEEPIPRITPDMSMEQAAEIYARELCRGRTFSAKELEEARQGKTDKELADAYARLRQETWEEVRRDFGSRAAAPQADSKAD